MSDISHQQLVQFDKEAKAKGFRFLFGVDEAGRGPLAGPVVAAAVCVPDSVVLGSRIGDSKLLTPKQRERAFLEIMERASVGIGIMNEKIIDAVNILRATHLAMTGAVKELSGRVPDGLFEGVVERSSVKVLIDGNSYSGGIPYQVERIVKGDSKSLAIACASIVAKVYRDRLMEKYDTLYPGYGFSRHKGYPSLAHREAVKRLGACPIHRKTFNVK